MPLKVKLKTKVLKNLSEEHSPLTNTVTPLIAGGNVIPNTGNYRTVWCRSRNNCGGGGNPESARNQCKWTGH